MLLPLKVHSLFWVRSCEHDTEYIISSSYFPCPHASLTSKPDPLYLHLYYSAPTDDAFAKLPNGTVDTLLLPENIDKLTNILLTHVIDGAVNSTMLNGGTVETLSGNTVEAVVNDDGSISFNINGSNANVILADVDASNGIIHAIDVVLLPP